MDRSDNFIKLYSNCIIVNGKKRSLLCDLQKEKSYYVPNELHEISTWFDQVSIEEIKKKCNSERINVIEGYIEFLITNEFAFYCSNNELEFFPKLSMEWDFPAQISNAVLDIDKQSKFDFHNVFLQLEAMGCRDVQLRINDVFSLSEIAKILSSAENRTIKSIELFLNYDPNIEDEIYVQLSYKFPRITGFYLHSSDKDEILIETSVPPLVIAKISQKINYRKHCGVFDERFFAVTTELFTESQHHNTCLNRKISIDVTGEIKNCPSMEESFGNIRVTTLEEALATKGFTKYWNIKKDQISVCKDCEFRHICTDCRGFLEDPEDIYSKPLKCGYDPYTGKWSDWSKNPLKQMAIEYYQL